MYKDIVNIVNKTNMEAEIITKPDWKATLLNMKKGDFLDFPEADKPYFNNLRWKLRDLNYRYVFHTERGNTTMLCVNSPKD